jgi:predicted RNA binding protein YcfA (HicA-like mRNA interferase family)
MLVVKGMRLRDIERALAAAGCIRIGDDGRHTKWRCPCGKHSTAVPRHKDISPGVVGNVIHNLDCLGKGWLQ